MTVPNTFEKAAPLHVDASPPIAYLPLAAWQGERKRVGVLRGLRPRG